MAETGLRLSLPAERGWKSGRALPGCCLAAAILLGGLLFLLPEARNGLKILCNALFARSEEVNSYRYARFQAAPGQGIALAAGLLSLTLLFLSFSLLIVNRRIFGLAAAAALALMQAYFGLSLPFWLNALCFSACGLALLNPVTFKTAGALALTVLLIGAVLSAAWPQVDEATESASERVRDSLSRAAQSLADGGLETLPDAIKETRHVNTQSLSAGSAKARPDREYRLVNVEEEKISIPRWIDYLKIALLLLLSVALVILPFVPFALLNQRRKRAKEARAAFSSGNISEAVCAMFAHVIRYLEAAGMGGGNKLYRRWADALDGRMPKDYTDAFRACGALFEEAKYSDHALTEEQRLQMARLLAETEKLLFDQADFKRRLYLRYGKCLHE